MTENFDQNLITGDANFINNIRIEQLNHRVNYEIVNAINYNY